MIFSEQSTKLILAGKKTMTTRLAKEREELIHLDSGKDAVVSDGGNGRIKWQVGKTYCVKFKRTGKAIIYNPKTGEVTDDY